MGGFVVWMGAMERRCDFFDSEWPACISHAPDRPDMIGTNGDDTGGPLLQTVTHKTAPTAGRMYAQAKVSPFEPTARAAQERPRMYFSHSEAGTL